MKPPAKLKYQNVSGTILARAFSDAIHCTMKRIENMACARKPIVTQTSSVVDVSCHQCTKLLSRFIVTTPHQTLTACADNASRSFLRVARRRSGQILFDRRQDRPLAQPAYPDKVIEAD